MKYENIQIVLAIKKCSHTVRSGHQSCITKMFMWNKIDMQTLSPVPEGIHLICLQKFWDFRGSEN
jgi:hypothetical protein